MILSEWWALWRADPRATPFQSPAWLDSWWVALGSGERRDVLVRDDDRLVAALPMRVQGMTTVWCSIPDHSR